MIIELDDNTAGVEQLFHLFPTCAGYGCNSDAEAGADDSCRLSDAAGRPLLHVESVSQQHTRR